jgi:hypothetical protein
MADGVWRQQRAGAARPQADDVARAAVAPSTSIISCKVPPDARRTSDTLRRLMAGLALLALAGCTPVAPDAGMPARPVPAEPVEAVAAAGRPVVTATLEPTGTAAPVAAAPTRAVATPSARLEADLVELPAGGCVTVRWSVAGARRVRMAGREVPGTGSERACPEQDQTFYLWYEGPDGRPGERTLTVHVMSPTEAAAALAAGDPAAVDQADREEERRSVRADPTPEPTPCPTECVVLAPTERPRPTRPPRPTVAPDPTGEPEPTPPPDPTGEPGPTDRPDPTREPVPTDEPAPTDEPTGEPTDEPAPTDEPEPTSGTRRR